MQHDMNDHCRFLQSELSRRALLKYSIAGLAGLTLGPQILQTLSAQGAGTPPSPAGLRLKGSRSLLPPLFCTAYIDPDIPSQAGQESLIARYPLTLVPQDMRATHTQWRDRIKQLNSAILMLGYLMVIEETTVPGPGHDVMRLVKNSWCVHPGGYYPTVQIEPGPRTFRIFDPRKPEWQESFLAACRATLQSYPYDGVYLDQCTVYDIAHPLPNVRAEMRQALQVILLRLRQEFPSAILIGNSSYDWAGLNGELNEGRPGNLRAELAPFIEHAQPEIQLYQSLLRNPFDIETVKREMAAAHLYGAFYGAAPVNNYQHALWFEVFNEVIAAHRQ